MKYKVTATFVFEDVEAESQEEAQAWVDGTSFHSYIEHPKKDERVNPSYEVEEILLQNACPYCKGIGLERLSNINVRCRFCGGSGNIK